MSRKKVGERGVGRRRGILVNNWRIPKKTQASDFLINCSNNVIQYLVAKYMAYLKFLCKILNELDLDIWNILTKYTKAKKERNIFYERHEFTVTYILLNKKTINILVDDKILKYLAYTLIVTFKI